MGERENEPKNMLRENFEQLGDDLGDAVRKITEKVCRISSAAELGNLRRDVNDALHGIREAIPRPSRPAAPEDSQSLRPSAPRSYHLSRRQNTETLALHINKKKYGYGRSLFKTLVGALGTVSSASAAASAATMINLVPELTTGVPVPAEVFVPAAQQGAIQFFGILTLFFGIYGLKWFSRFRMASVLRSYSHVIGDRTYYSLAALAAATGRSESRVRKDIRKLLRKGGFHHCALDDEGQTLLIGAEAYRLYTEVKRSPAPAPAEPAPAEPVVNAESAVRSPVEELEISSAAFLAHIRAINDALPEKEISDKLDKLEEISGRIFRYVEQHPDKLPQIRRFMDYYLPTTLKLMEAYRELTGHGSYGEVEETKAEIHSAMAKINHAFENLFGNLLRGDLMNLSADISALETMLAQEGLSSDENACL